MNRKKTFKRTILSSALLLACFQVSADEAAPEVSSDAGLVESLTGFNINEASFMKDSGFEFGMWASAGITGNTHGDNTNAPVLFNDRVNEVLFNELNFYLERSVTQGDSWDFGGRMDFMFGTDARFTQASGWDDKWGSNGDGRGYYEIAMPQLYVEVYAPFGNGVTAKLGHFYTTIGYEVVPAPDNFFYSHAYTMLYAEPFTHTGLMLSYDINDNFSVNGGAVMGWDNMTENAGAWSFLGGVGWTSNDAASSVTVQIITGNQSDTVSGNTTMYSIVATHDFSDQLHYVLQHDFGTMRDASYDSVNWFGINQYVMYDINDQLGIGLRAEWFNDKGGANRVGPIGANYLAASFGLNYTPLSWLKLRPEIRYDWADEKAFNDNRTNDQVEFAMDLIITF